MTNLRDARLQRALHEAPDAGPPPQQRTREAIRTAAHAAVRPWWQRWLPAAGGARWTSALATVLLAGLVTVLWQGQEIPGPRRADPPMAAAAPAERQEQAAPAAPAAPAADHNAVIPGLTWDPAPPVARPARPAQPAPRRSHAEDAVADLARKAQAREQPVAAPAEAPAAAVAEAAPAAPAPAAMPDTASPDLSRRAAGESRPRGPVAALAAQRQPAPAAWERWTQVRLEGEGASVVVPRAQAGRLPELVGGVLRGEPVPPPAPGTPQLRLELAQDGEPLGVLESVGGQWRWQALDATEPARGLRPPPALDAELREEAQRLLRR